MVAGGADRQESVWRGLQRLPEDARVRRGARRGPPFITAELVERVLAAAACRRRGHLRAAGAGDREARDATAAVEATVPRQGLWLTQTPQAFARDLLGKRTTRRAATASRAPTTRCWWSGWACRWPWCEGLRAESQDHDARGSPDGPGLGRAPPPRMTDSGPGSASTCIRWSTGRPLVLGGVTVPAERGLGGHSDADVLTHAVCEALLGVARPRGSRTAVPGHRSALQRSLEPRSAAVGDGPDRRARERAWSTWT